MKNIRILIRTHYIDEKIYNLFNKWSLIAPGKVSLLLDITYKKHVCSLPMIAFDLKLLEKKGLPNRPHGRAAWHCGDYTMAAASDHMTDDDFWFVVEHDVVPGIKSIPRWQSLLTEMSAYDIVGYHFKKRNEPWRWRKEINELYGDTEVFGMLIMFLGFSKKTAELMMQRRKDLALLKTEAWPFCEAFVGTESHVSNLRVASIDKFLGRLNDFTTAKPLLFAKVIEDDREDTLFHPALDRSKYITNMRYMIGRSSPADVEAKIRELGPMTAREIDIIEGLYRRATGSSMPLSPELETLEDQGR